MPRSARPKDAQGHVAGGLPFGDHGAQRTDAAGDAQGARFLGFLVRPWICQLGKPAKDQQKHLCSSGLREVLRSITPVPPTPPPRPPRLEG